MVDGRKLSAEALGRILATVPTQTTMDTVGFVIERIEHALTSGSVVDCVRM
jgi:hypothetical protein